jgi:hypothetical protein
LIISKKLKKSDRLRLRNIFPVITLIFIAGGATVFARSFQTWEQPLALTIPFLLSIWLLVKYKIGVSKKFILLILLFLVYFILLTFKYDEIHYKFLVIYPLSFFIAYSFVSSLKADFFTIYERLLKLLCLIALFFWVLQVIIPEQLTSILSSLTILKPYNEIIQAHILVYSILNEGIESFLPRNSGFAWEPGAFAVFINLAIFANLIRNSFKIRKNINLLIFVLTLLSTQSTTGYSIFLLLAAFYFINIKGISLKILLIPIVLIGVVYIFSLPFMYEKITGLGNEKISDVVDTGSKDWNKDKMIGAQRFVSFQIDFIDFLNNPILGYGGHDEDMWIKKSKINVVSISGIGKILAKFGLVGFIFFIVVLYRNSVQFAKFYGYKGKLLLFLLILQVSVSYSLIENPLLMCFWMFFFFNPKLSTTTVSTYSMNRISNTKKNGN